ncbi:hypothetical protein OKW38_003744 [Paraburkholderia sp. MM5496-R1]|uniref:hypothetical protein n=1 Tax=Paraburkholderia sp. MM5496-R1 TaxID=2991065 RepID=UPI003D1E1486
MSTPFWIMVKGSGLAQGDLLHKCLIPKFGEDFGASGEGASESVPVGEADLIIVTQSCDLENGKVDLVALCPVYTLEEFEGENEEFKAKGKWEAVRKGRVEGLHLLGSPRDPTDNRGSLVVDFGQIFSLPPAYLSKLAEACGEHWRLDSPFLEHFSQAFARYFMRVGLPSQIPAFK